MSTDIPSVNAAPAVESEWFDLKRPPVVHNWSVKTVVCGWTYYQAASLHVVRTNGTIWQARRPQVSTNETSARIARRSPRRA